MANIIITNYCNLSCPYCFANKHIKETEKENITLEQLENIFQWLAKTPINRIGLIGGEPTLHPNFDLILKATIDFCEKNNTYGLLFTNGIELEQYIHLLTPRIKILINLNHPDILKEDKWNKLQNTLKSLEKNNMLKQVSFGINLYHDIKTYNYIFDLLNQYGKYELRVSYVAPTNKYLTFNKEEYYLKAKQIFLPFMEQAKQNNIIIKIDCNHIPNCYFSEKEQEFLDSCLLEKNSDYCQPVIDITPNFEGTACFGAYELINLHQFENIKEAERYFYFKIMYPKVLHNNTSKCNNCQKYQTMACQGGCLAFASK